MSPSPVLDIHTHPVTPHIWPEPVWRYVETSNPEVAARAEELADPQAMMEMLRGEGVDQACVLAEEAPLTTGMVTSEFVITFAAKAQGLHPFVSLNPNLDHDMASRLDSLRSLAAEQGTAVAGIKLFPSYQHFHPADARLYPLYGLAQDLDLPITFHTGTSRFPGTRLKYADPLLLDDVAVDFPRLPILLAHSGRGIWYEAAAMLATLHANVYLEISGLPSRNLPHYFPNLERVADKMVFGTDFPGLRSIRENIEAINELFAPEQAHRILWETGARLVGLT